MLVLRHGMVHLSIIITAMAISIFKDGTRGWG